MTKLFRQRLMWRLMALGVLVLCFIAISRDVARLATARQLEQNPMQRETPIITPQNQTGAPLVISIARPIPGGTADGELSFTVSNISAKTIRAFAIKQDVGDGSSVRSSVSTYNLELTNSELQPNGSLSDFSTFETLSEKRHEVSLSVEYAEFSDGTSWGPDSAKSKERVAGQRAGAMVLSKRLIKVLNESEPKDVVSAIDDGLANIEPPVGRSEEWKQGFRAGCQVTANRLKAMQSKDGSAVVESELHKLAQRFKGAQ